MLLTISGWARELDLGAFSEVDSCHRKNGSRNYYKRHNFCCQLVFFLLFRFCSGTVSYFPDIYDTLSGFPQYSRNFVFDYHCADKNKNYIFLSLEIFRSDIMMWDVYDKSLKQWKFGRQRLRWHEIRSKLTSTVIVKIIDGALNQPTKQIILRKKANMFYQPTIKSKALENLPHAPLLTSLSKI